MLCVRKGLGCRYWCYSVTDGLGECIITHPVAAFLGKCSF